MKFSGYGPIHIHNVKVCPHKISLKSVFADRFTMEGARLLDKGWVYTIELEMLTLIT